MHQKDWYTSTHGGLAKEKNLSRLPKPVDHLSAGDGTSPTAPRLSFRFPITATTLFVSCYPRPTSRACTVPHLDRRLFTGGKDWLMELTHLSRNTAPERSQLQQIIAGLTEGVILLEPDQTITYANDAALDMHGVTRLEELGLTVDEYRRNFVLHRQVDLTPGPGTTRSTV